MELDSDGTQRRQGARPETGDAPVGQARVEGDAAGVRRWPDFLNTQYGARLAFTQVAVQPWRDRTIVDERFYYSPQPVEAE